VVSLADRLTSNHLGHQTLDAIIDPFHAFSLARTPMRGLAQIAMASRRLMSKVFSLRRMLQAIRASLLARAVASFRSCWFELQSRALTGVRLWATKRTSRVGASMSVDKGSGTPKVRTTRLTHRRHQLSQQR